MFGLKARKELEKKIQTFEEQEEINYKKIETLEADIADLKQTVEKIIELHEGEWQ